MRNFTLCWDFEWGVSRLGWAIEKVLYDKVLHMGLGFILRVKTEGKQNQKRQWNPPSLSRVCRVLRLCLFGWDLWKFSSFLGYHSWYFSNIVGGFGYLAFGSWGGVRIGWMFIFNTVSLTFPKLLEKLMSFSFGCFTPKFWGYGGQLSSVRGLKVESTTTCTVKEVCLWKTDTRQYIKEASWSQLTWKYWVTLTVPKNISILNYMHGIYIFNTSFLWCSSTILPYKKNALRST